MANDDISEQEAHKMFVAVHASMVSSGLIDGARIRIAGVVLRKLHASEGDQSGMRRTWIDEHIFFVPLTVDGIRVGTEAKEYGLSVNVHRSGRVRRIEISGAGIAANEPGAATVTSAVVRAQRGKSAVDVARTTIGASDVTPLGLRFVLNEDSDGGEAVARELFQVTPKSTGPSGETVYGKSYVASHAVNDASDVVEFSPKPGALGLTPSDRVFSK